MSSFDSLGLQEDLVRVISERGWDLPRDVQDESIPHILNGNDVLIASETGSGKTGALGLPMLQLINEFTTTKASFDLQTQHIIPQLTEYIPENVGINIRESDNGWEFTSSDGTSTFANPDLEFITGPTVTANWGRSGLWGGLRANVGATTGQYYFETTITQGHLVRVGLAMKTANLEIGQDVNSIGWGSTGFLVYGGKFLPLPGQNAIECGPDSNNSTIFDGLSPNPQITYNPNNDPQTPEQREMVCYHPGDTIGLACDFINNQLTLYRMRPTSNSTKPITTTRIALIKDPFYQDCLYFPSLCTKDGNTSIDINLNGPFINPIFAPNSDPFESSNHPLINTFLPFSHCVKYYQCLPIPQNAKQHPQALYTSYYNLKVEVNEQNPVYREFLSIQGQDSNIKGLIITPTPGLCEQMYNEMTAFAKYLEPPVSIGICVSTTDPRCKHLHQYDIVVATVGLLEQQFGTSMVDRPKFNSVTGSLIQNDAVANKRRQNWDVSQVEFNGVMFLPLTNSSSEALIEQTKTLIRDSTTATDNQPDIPTLLQTTPLRHQETGPLLNNCIFFTIDEADAFGDRLNSDTIYRITTRIKRDKDRAMTRLFLNQFNPITQSPTSQSPQQPEQVDKVPRCQIVMASATIDPEKMKLLFPLLRKSYSTVHLRERYELPKGLLQGSIIINGGKFFSSLGQNGNFPTNINSITNNNTFWTSAMIQEKFLDCVHEFGVELPPDNNFHRLTIQKMSDDENQSTVTTTTTPFTTAKRAPPTADEQRIINSQATKMYKLAVLGQILGLLTQTPSRFATTLSTQTITQTFNPQDLSHLNVDVNDTDAVIALADDNGEVSQPQESEQQQPLNPPQETDSTSTILTSLIDFAPQSTQQKPMREIIPSQLEKFLIFCQSNNDCIRVALFLSYLIENGQIKLPAEANRPPPVIETTPNNTTSSSSSSPSNNEQPSSQHQNKKQKGGGKNNSNNANKKYTYEETQGLSAYPSSSLLNFKYHPAVACLINRGQSKDQLNQIFADFQAKKIAFLICTDLGARGLDFHDVPVVIHFNTPRHPEIYVQRCGRTARGGASKLGLSLCLVNNGPEYIWYHTHNQTDECEGSILGPDNKLRKGGNNSNGGGIGGQSVNGINGDVALEDSSHPCVKIQHEKIYLDDIQEKIGVRFAPVYPSYFAGTIHDDTTHNNNNNESTTMNDTNDGLVNQISSPQPQFMDHHGNVIPIAFGYDSLVGNLYLRQKQEDICSNLHKQHSHIILQQNQLLSEIQQDLQRSYFEVINRCPFYNAVLAGDINLDDQEDPAFYSDIGSDYPDLDLSDVDEVV